MISIDQDSNGDGCFTIILFVIVFFIGSCTGANSVYEEAQNRGLGKMKNGDFIWEPAKEEKEEKDENNR